MTKRCPPHSGEIIGLLLDLVFILIAADLPKRMRIGVFGLPAAQFLQI